MVFLRLLLLRKTIVSRFTPNQKKFVAEIVDTFIIIVLATSAVVIDIKFSGTFRIAFLPLVGVAIAIYLFAKISMAHFNPAVTLDFSFLDISQNCNYSITFQQR